MSELAAGPFRDGGLGDTPTSVFSFVTKLVHRWKFVSVAGR